MKNWDIKLFLWLLLCLLIFFYLNTAKEKNKTIDDFKIIEDTIYYSKIYNKVRKTDEGERIDKQIHIGIEERKALVILDYSNYKKYSNILLSPSNIGKRIKLFIEDDESEIILDAAQIEIEGEIIVPFSHREKYFFWVNLLLLFFIIINSIAIFAHYGKFKLSKSDK